MKKYIVIYHSIKKIECIIILWWVLVLFFVHLTSKLASIFSYTFYCAFIHSPQVTTNMAQPTTPKFLALRCLVIPMWLGFYGCKILPLLKNRHKNLHLLHLMIYICLGSSQCVLHVLQWVKPTSGDIPKIWGTQIKVSLHPKPSNLEMIWSLTLTLTFFLNLDHRWV
jgi:hypothetical protein